MPESTAPITPSELNTAVSFGKLSTDIAYIKDAMRDLTAAFVDFKKEIKDSYATKDQLKVLDDRFTNKIVSIESRVSNLEAGATWLIRIIIGAVITAAMGYILISR